MIVDRAADEDDLMMAALDAGAEDLADDEVVWRVTCAPTDVEDVRRALEDAGFPVRSSDTAMIAANLVPLDDAAAAKSVLSLIDALEDSDDVQDVHANFDISDDVFATLDAG